MHLYVVTRLMKQSRNKECLKTLCVYGIFTYDMTTLIRVLHKSNLGMMANYFSRATTVLCSPDFLPIAHSICTVHSHGFLNVGGLKLSALYWFADLAVCCISEGPGDHMYCINVRCNQHISKRWYDISH